MKKRLVSVVLGVLLISSFLAALSWSISLKAFSLDSYLSLWEKYDVPKDTGMSFAELNKAGKALLDYLAGKTPSPNLEVNILGQMRELYNDKELTHLKDVRSLFAFGVLLRNVSTAITIGIALTVSVMVQKGVLQKKEGFTLLGKALVYSGVIPLLLGLSLAIAAMVDFTSFWRAFHLLAFTNDLWLLDPSNDWLIKMFPEGIFLSIVKEITINLAFFSAIYMSFGLGAIFSVRHTSSYHRH